MSLKSHHCQNSHTPVYLVTWHAFNCSSILLRQDNRVCSCVVGLVLGCLIELQLYSTALILILCKKGLCRRPVTQHLNTTLLDEILLRNYKKLSRRLLAFLQTKGHRSLCTQRTLQDWNEARNTYCHKSLKKKQQLLLPQKYF